MRRALLSSAALALALITAAITALAQTSLAPASPSQEGARVRFIHASPDTPAVDVLLDESETFTATEFGQITEYTDVATGTYTVTLRLTGLGTAALTDTVLITETDYTLAAAGTSGGLELLTLVDDNSAPAPGMVRGRFVHLVPGAPAVDIAIKDGPILFSNVGFKGVGGYVEVAAGSYELEIRLTGTSIVVTTVPLTVTPNNVYTFFAVGTLSDPQIVQSVDQAHGHTVWLPLVTRGG
jgi:hypothetical protein